MHPDLVTMTQRVTRLRSETADGLLSKTLMSAIDDLLTEGYARALAGDAWSMRAEQRLHDLIGDSLASHRGSRLRTLSVEHDDFQRDLLALRRELAALRLDRDRLRARSRTLST